MKQMLAGKTPLQNQTDTEVCQALGRIVHVVKEIVQTNARLEAKMDKTVKVAAKTYSSLAAAAQYYGVRVKVDPQVIARNASFKQLLNLVGNTLSPKIYLLISHIDVS